MSSADRRGHRTDNKNITRPGFLESENVATDRHHSFADRHPQHVQSHTLGNDEDSKSTLLGLFRNVTRSGAAVHIIDCRAQADGLIFQAMESL